MPFTQRHIEAFFRLSVFVVTCAELFQTFQIRANRIGLLNDGAFIGIGRIGDKKRAKIVAQFFWEHIQ
ncbi:Uncharacterised protein [Vibrio cholerae]|uniref:Uncharacterized protein n=1 Tax=Vibrio cholerae TaxID=666 RepID=A0A655NUR8_VIBCL|nr:Uncharacterised protein [Vibrio cholerae]